VNNKLVRVVAGAVIIAIILIVVALLPSNDICSDDVRGYEREASSSLNVVRKNFNAIEAIAGVEEIYKVEQLDRLNPASFAALRACDVQCKLLRQCLRFVFLNPPSQACPSEYGDYKEATKSALSLLEELHRLQLATEQAAQKAEQLGRVRKDVEEVEKFSGSTGGRLAVLRAQARQLESDLSQALSDIDQQMGSLISRKSGSTEE
jgi:hypothetical protein